MLPFALAPIRRFLERNESVERLHVVCFTEEVYEAYWEIMQDMATE